MKDCLGSLITLHKKLNIQEDVDAQITNQETGQMGYDQGKRSMVLTLILKTQEVSSSKCKKGSALKFNNHCIHFLNNKTTHIFLYVGLVNFNKDRFDAIF